MKLVRGAWKLLVGIKDALVLVAMLLFFAGLYAALNARSAPATIGDGALVLDLDGPIVEQPEEVPAFALLSGRRLVTQHALRDVLRAIRAAKTDTRIKAIVLDLDRFGGAYPAALGEVAAALADVRASGKPVLAFATGYTDGGYRLAAAASEIWMDPMGGALFAGPGGTRLYYKGLIDRLGINAHVYRVGRYKAAVEPYTRAGESPESKEASEALYGALFEQWRQAVARYRPKAQVTPFVTDPAGVVRAARGDVAQADLRAGIVDRLGDRTAFGRRVAQIAGAENGKPAGSFRAVKLARFLDADPLPTRGAVGVVTIAGDIVDGEASPGTAGGDTISKRLLAALARKDLKALVVRVDSPGGSVLASEKIRRAIMEAKRQGLPVVVSMGGVAASGGYWVSTPADVIFAEPDTITGSIGIFGIVPTFENTLAKVGLSTDGVKTTPLSGQPDVLAGTNAAVDGVIQSSIENGYAQFLSRVSQSRRLPVARVDEIGQGRVWIGGTARQLGLVDRFGSLQDAVAEATRRAKLTGKDAGVVYLEKKPGFAADIARQIQRRNDDDDGDDMANDGAGGDALARFAWQQRAGMAQALGDVRRMLTGASVRAQCLECGGLGPVTPRAQDARLLDLLLAKVGL